VLKLLLTVQSYTSGNKTSEDSDEDQGSATGIGRGSNRSATYREMMRWHNHWITAALV
jgi:hypothetical protein